MSESKHFNKIAWAVTALILVITVLFMNADKLGIEAKANTMGYENRLFDNTKVHTIDIVMDDWDEFINNATSEEYYTAALVIDGEAYKNVGIRGKGNTSLSSVSSMNSERYSFKVEFDHYDNSITYHGLDKLSLNNLIQDATMMKDYLTYTMMYEFGAATPLCSFVYITVNGEDWGLYLAVEGIEDSFLERNYGSDYGELYKPDSMSFGGGRGNGKDFNMDDFMNSQESSDGTEQETTMLDMNSFDPSSMFGGDMSNFDPSSMFGGDMSSFDPSSMFGGDMGNFDFSQMPGEFGGDMSDSGTDDSSQTQGDMTQKPDKAQGETDSEGRDKSSFGGGFDFSAMGGFGGFGMGSSDVKLQYIDDDTSSYSNIWNNAKTDITTADQNRLIESLKKLSNGEEIESVVDIEAVIRYFVVHNYVCNGDSYTGAMVHNYYLYEENGQMAMIPWDYNLAYGTFQGGNGQSTVNTPIDAPVSGGSGEDRPMWSWILSDESYTELYHQYYEEFLNTVDIQAIIDNAYNLIKSYVEKDPTAFYTYEEFETAVETMRRFCTLRSESISMQLANGETTSTMSYADASGLTLSDMGSMGGGKGGFGDMPGRDSGKSGFGGEMSGGGSDKSGFGASQMPSDFGGMFSGWGSAGSESSDDAGNTEATDGTDAADGTESTDNTEATDGSARPSRDNMQMPNGSWGSGMSGISNAASGNTDWIWLVVSVLILGAGLLIAKLYKRY